MRIRAAILVPAALLLSLSSGTPAQEKAPATDTPPVLSQSLDTSAKAALKRLGSLYGPAWTLTYTSAITTKEYGPTSGTVTQTILVKGLLQKPNKFRVELIRAGKVVGLLVSDGKTVYGYEPIKGIYAKSPAPADLSIVGVASALPGRRFSILPTWTERASAMPMLFTYATKPDILSSPEITTATTSITLNGKPAVDISAKAARSDRTDHLILDQETGFPMRLQTSQTNSDGKVSETQEDVSAVQTGAVELPASTFQWTPPAKAERVSADAPAAPPVKPKGASPAPARRRRTTAGHHRSSKIITT